MALFSMPMYMYGVVMVGGAVGLVILIFCCCWVCKQCYKKSVKKREQKLRRRRLRLQSDAQYNNAYNDDEYYFKKQRRQKRPPRQVDGAISPTDVDYYESDDDDSEYEYDVERGNRNSSNPPKMRSNGGGNIRNHSRSQYEREVTKASENDSDVDYVCCCFVCCVPSDEEYPYGDSADQDHEKKPQKAVDKKANNAGSDDDENSIESDEDCEENASETFDADNELQMVYAGTERRCSRGATQSTIHYQKNENAMNRSKSMESISDAMIGNHPRRRRLSSKTGEIMQRSQSTESLSKLVVVKSVMDDETEESVDWSEGKTYVNHDLISRSKSSESISAMFAVNQTATGRADVGTKPKMIQSRSVPNFESQTSYVDVCENDENIYDSRSNIRYGNESYTEKRPTYSSTKQTSFEPSRNAQSTEMVHSSAVPRYESQRNYDNNEELDYIVRPSEKHNHTREINEYPTGELHVGATRSSAKREINRESYHNNKITHIKNSGHTSVSKTNNNNTLPEDDIVDTVAHSVLLSSAAANSKSNYIKKTQNDSPAARPDNNRRRDIRQLDQNQTRTSRKVQKDKRGFVASYSNVSDDEIDDVQDGEVFVMPEIKTEWDIRGREDGQGVNLQSDKITNEALSSTPMEPSRKRFVKGAKSVMNTLAFSLGSSNKNPKSTWDPLEGKPKSNMPNANKDHDQETKKKNAVGTSSVSDYFSTENESKEDAPERRKPTIPKYKDERLSHFRGSALVMEGDGLPNTDYTTTYQSGYNTNNHRHSLTLMARK